MKNNKATTKTATKAVAPVTTSKKVATKKEEASVERVTLGSTTYHIWRNWAKETFRTNGVITAKFIKEEGSYDGIVTVAKSEVDKAKKVLTEYTKKHSVELVAL